MGSTSIEGFAGSAIIGKNWLSVDSVVDWSDESLARDVRRIRGRWDSGFPIVVWTVTWRKSRTAKLDSHSNTPNLSIFFERNITESVLINTSCIYSDLLRLFSYELTLGKGL